MEGNIGMSACSKICEEMNLGIGRSHALESAKRIRERG